MCKASILKIVRLAAAWTFFWWGHKKSQKNDFFHKTLISQNLLKEANIQARSMWKLTSWRFRKCGTYWACHVFNGSYRPSKMDESEKTGPSPKISGVQKKDTATILKITARNWISVETTMLVPRWFNFGAQNSKLWPCLFFLTSPLLKICSSIFTQLWRPITMVWNLQNSKTTTFSELPGRWLSHGTTLYRSYIFKKLSNLRFSFSSFGVFWRFQHRAPDVPL